MFPSFRSQSRMKANNWYKSYVWTLVSWPTKAREHRLAHAPHHESVGGARPNEMDVSWWYRSTS